MVRCLFDDTELGRLWCSTKQNYQKLCTKALSIRVPIVNNLFLLIWIFLSNSFEEHVSKPFEPSNDLRVALVCQSMSG